MRALLLALCCSGIDALLKQKNSAYKFCYHDCLSCLKTMQYQFFFDNHGKLDERLVHSRLLRDIRSYETVIFAKTAATVELNKRGSEPVMRLLKFLLAIIFFVPKILLSGLSFLFGRRKSTRKRVISSTSKNSTILLVNKRQNSQPYQWYNEAYMRATGVSRKSIFDYRPWARQKKWSPHNVINKEGALSPKSISEWRIKSNDTALMSFSYPSSFSEPSKVAQKLTVVELNKLNDTRSFSLNVKEFAKVSKMIPPQHENSHVESLVKSSTMNNETVSLSSTKSQIDKAVASLSAASVLDVQMTNAKAVKPLSKGGTIPTPKELVIPPRSTSILVQSLALYPNSKPAPSTAQPVKHQRQTPITVKTSQVQPSHITNSTTSQVTSKWTDDDASLLGSLMTGAVVTVAFGWEPGVLMAATSGFLVARNYNMTGKIVHNVGELALASIKLASAIDNSFNVSSTIKSQVVSALRVPKK